MQTACFDTIAAISTSSGKAAISVIRVSGKDAISVCDIFFKGKKKLADSKSNSVVFGQICDGERFIDEVLVTVFRTPKSYTGEDLVEISSHGNPFINGQIMELLLQKCRLAERGEFTQRAFFNNKMDLTQAEAVADLIEAKTKQSQLTALEQLEGSLHKKITKYLNQITELRTLLELEIDFADQELDTLNIEEFNKKLDKLTESMQQLVESGEEGMILREGLKISLVGAPNVGKSSLFNAFLQSERAIVTPVPGTTRDYIEEAIALDGYLIRFFDTAGLRETDDHVEKIGINRSYSIVEQSNLIVFITDNEHNQTEYSKISSNIDQGKIIKVLNKTDLLTGDEIREFTSQGYIPTSAVMENGLLKLKERILSYVKISDSDIKSGILTNSRQIAAAKRAIEGCRKAAFSFQAGMGYEFTAFDLKEASEALEELIGKVTDDDILNKIFSEFCIGK